MKLTKKLLAIMLSLIMVFTMIAVPVSAAGTIAEDTAVEEVVGEETTDEEAAEEESVGEFHEIFEAIRNLIEAIHNLVGGIMGNLGKECPFCGEVHEKDVEEEPDEFVDTDKDGISDEEEAVYGTDANKADTDDDGYTDFEELFLMGTDPLKTDEKDIDTDADGLTDYDEVKKYGTDINSEDTDGDDLTDYDEVNRYNTDPTKKDTDDDGLSDAFEIENGLDPTKASTDGKTSDADVKFEQTTSEESVSDALLDEENVAKPSLEGEVAGDLSEKVFISTSPDSSLDDNRAVIGEPIVVDGDKEYVDDLKLSFELSTYEGALENLSICKLDEDGNILPVESDLTGSSISCSAEADATYFVMDIDAFLKALGVDLDAYKAMRFSLRGRSAEVAGDKVSGQADIVFAIDTTGSMSGTINNVIYNVKDFTERLATEYSVKVNYALIDYRDLEEDGPGTTKVIKNGTSNWFSDVDTYGSALNTLYASGGGDGPECSVDALETARRLNFRKSASKFVILITDADYKVLNDYGIKSMDEVAAKLAADGINTSVVCPTYYKSLYENVYNTTGGIFADIYGDFSDELLKLADLIGEETSDGEWVILKHGYRYVKLPAIPTADSTADTDEDDISDYKELGKAMTVDLTPFIAFQLLVYGVPFEAYFGKTSITVYDSIADPTLYDTDGDGIKDSEDTAPWSVGLKGGVVGALKLFSHGKDNNTSGNNLGHAYVAYTSFVDDDLKLYGILVNSTSEVAGVYKDRPIENITNAPQFKYHNVQLTSNSVITIGGWAGWLAEELRGTWLNQEYQLYKDGTGSEQRSIMEYVTYSDVEKLTSFTKNHSKWTYLYNCSAFARDLWNEITSDKISSGTISTPFNLIKSMEKRDNCKTGDSLLAVWP